MQPEDPTFQSTFESFNNSDQTDQRKHTVDLLSEPGKLYSMLNSTSALLVQLRYSGNLQKSLLIMHDRQYAILLLVKNR